MRRRTKWAELRSSGAQVLGVQVDVSDPTAVTEAFAHIRDTLGPTEVLVTSAAIAGFTRFDKITLDEWNRYLAVNLTGTFLCLQAALPDMVAAEWGRIVTISPRPASRVLHGRATTLLRRAVSSP